MVETESGKLKLMLDNSHRLNDIVDCHRCCIFCRLCPYVDDGVSYLFVPGHMFPQRAAEAE